MQQKPRFSGGIVIAVVLVLALLMVTMYSSLSGTQTSTMAYSDVIEYFENNQVTAFELDLNTGIIELSLKEGEKPLPENAQQQTEATGLLEELSGGEDFGPKNGGTVVATYKLPYIDFFLSTLKDEGLIEQYNEANPDAPMVYDMSPVKPSIPWMELLLYVIMIGGVPVHLDVPRRRRRQRHHERGPCQGQGPAGKPAQGNFCRCGRCRGGKGRAGGSR